MTLGIFDPHAVNFVVRDIDTGEVREEFRTKYGAEQYLRTMGFGLRNFYEVYDTRAGKIISTKINIRTKEENSNERTTRKDINNTSWYKRTKKVRT